MTEREDVVARLASDDVRVERKPYVRPTLRRLGSVRDLTHSGGCVHMTDGSRASKKGM
jgi:hypothetical protein